MFNSDWIGAAINAGASHVNLGISSLWNQRLQNKAYQQQLSLQHDAQNFTDQQRMLQNEWSEAMWQKENEYNSPASQISRLEAAGINPNSYLSDPQSGMPVPSANSGASAGIGSAPMPPYIDPGMLNNGLSTFADSFKKIEEAIGQRIENKYKDKRSQIDIKEAEKRIDLMDSQINKYLADTELSKEQTDQIKTLLPIMVIKSEAEIANLEAATQKYQAERSNLLSEIALLREKINTEKSVQAANYESAELSRRSQENVSMSTQNLEVERDIKEKEFELKQSETRYKTVLYNNNIDPDKIDYNVKNPVGTLISIANMVKNDFKQ